MSGGVGCRHTRRHAGMAGRRCASWPAWARSNRALAGAHAIAGASHPSPAHAGRGRASGRNAHRLRRCRRGGARSGCPPVAWVVAATDRMFRTRRRDCHRHALEQCGRSCSWPRLGELNPMPDATERLAAACAAMPPLHPELPSAIGHAVLLRGAARRKAGGWMPAAMVRGTPRWWI